MPPEKDTRLTIRLENYQLNGIEAVADEHSVTNSYVARRFIDDGLTDIEDGILPEWVDKEISHQDMVDKNRWKMRRMHFAQNIADRLDEMLESRRPPRPEFVGEDYIASLKEQAREEFPDRAERYVMVCDQELLRYKVLHPNVESSPEDIRETFAAYLANDDKKAADSLKRTLKSEGSHGITVSSDTINHEYRQATQSHAQEQWLEEWKESIPTDGFTA